MLKILLDLFTKKRKFKKVNKKDFKLKINTHRRRFTDIKPQASQEDS